MKKKQKLEGRQWIKFKDGMTEPIHCERCNKKTKHYVEEPFHVIVMLMMIAIVIGMIIVLLAKNRFTCSKCENSYINWG